MKDVMYSLAIVCLAVVMFRSCSNERSLTKASVALRKEIFARDTMIRHNDSLVSILVRDNRTRQDLADSLTEALRLYVAGRDLSPTLVTKIEFVPVSKTDTVLYNQETGEYTSYYPDYSGWVIRHRLRPDEWGFFQADWDFNPIRFDMVVSETSAGLYEAAISGPGFIRVNRLTVHSLPRGEAKERQGFLLGGGAQFRWKDRTFVPMLQGGYEWRKHVFSAQVWTDGAGIHIMRKL
jgi:hypothetical protein